MGKAAKKKTRWRSFSFNSTTGSKEQIETTNDLENSTKLSSTIPNNSTTSNAKYSQILSNNNTTSTSNLSKDKTYNTNNNNNNSNYNYYNTKKHYNKENYNYYNGSNKKPSTNNKIYNKFNSELNSSSIRGIGRDKSLRSELSETVSGAGITNGKVDPSSSSSCSSSSVSDTTTNNTATTNLSNKESEDCKNDTKSTNVLFNEDEYTRITTPRQDVLFKKGYLSRMKSKTATDSSETNNINLNNISLNNHLNNNNNNNNSASDPDTSTISTLSPATTPSIMEYGGNSKYSPVSPEMMDYSQGFYYPGYYDEHGVLIVNPIFANGYNYYNSPNTPSTAGASPVYLMPYPYYSYDYYMPQSSTSPNANDEDTSNASNNNNSEETSEETTNDKSTTNPVDSKITIDEENNKNANINNNNNSSTNNNFNSDNGTSTPVSSSEDGVCSSNQGEENKEDPSNNQSDNVSNVSGNSSAPITKPAFPMYPNGDMNNGYLYPPPPQAFNGYFNGFYYYDARMANGPPPPHSRQIKMKRRKRFINSRNSQHSTENTTDYSDDEPPFPTYNKRFNYKRYNGYHHNRNFDHHSNHHHHHYNHYNYHYRPNRRFDDRHHYHRDMTANAETNSVDVSNLVMNTNLKVDVQEFYPRNNSNSIENQLIETTIVDESINEMQEEEKDATEIPTVQVVIKKTSEFEQKTQPKMEKPQKIPPTKESTQTKVVASRDTSIKSSSSQIVSSSTNHPPAKPHKTSKKEIFESLKSLEQQNIDLMAHSKLLQSQQPKPQTNDVEWNVIKSSKGKRIKFVSKHVNGNGTEKAIVNGGESSSTSFEEEKDVMIQENVSEPVQLESIEKEVQDTDESRVPTSPSKDLSASSKQNKKSKKPKNKKNKKLSVVGKLEGFEIIEPEFGDNANEQIPDEPETDETNVQTVEIVENAVINQEVLPETVQTTLSEPETADQPIQEEISIETVLVQEPQIAKLLQNTRIACDDNEIIDINDNDIRCSVQTIDVVESKIIETIQEVNKKELNGFYAETNGTIEHEIEDISVNKLNDVIEKVNGFEELNNIPELVEANGVEEKKPQEEPNVVQELEKMPELIQETKKKNVKELPKETKEIVPEIKDLKESTKENKNPIESVPKEKTKMNGKEKRALKEKVPLIEIPEQNPLLDKENFRKENIAELEREVVENLKLLDTDIEIKSPIIMKNLITDFPITNAIKQWLTEKQNESFDSLFHIPNDPSIHNKIYNMCSTSSPKEDQVEEDDISDEEELDGESDISDDKITNHPIATINIDSGVDSDYQSDIQLVMGSGEKASSSPAYKNNNDNINASSNSKKQNTKNSSKDKSNNAKLFMVKDKLCLLM